jgi:hypothetical protein
VLWRLFWHSYFLFGSKSAFHENYLEAWKQKFDEEQSKQIPPLGERSIVIFKDSDDKLEIPCRRDMDDNLFFQQISRFYYLRKVEIGLVEMIGFKSLNYIEVVKVTSNLVSSGL